jgi:hypothetical protein
VASRVVGISRPRALALLKLTTSSNLVGACTGRSAGFLALEDAIYIVRGVEVWVERNGRVRDQSAVFATGTATLVIVRNAANQADAGIRETECRRRSR